jgi:hypothetical protein
MKRTDLKLGRVIRWLPGILGVLLMACTGIVPARADFSRPAPRQGPTRVTLTVFFLDVTGVDFPRFRGHPSGLI